MYSLNGIPLKKKKIERTDGQTDGRMDRQTNGRTVRLYYAPNFIWGHNKKRSLSGLSCLAVKQLQTDMLLMEVNLCDTAVRIYSIINTTLYK